MLDVAQVYHIRWKGAVAINLLLAGSLESIRKWDFPHVRCDTGLWLSWLLRHRSQGDGVLRLHGSLSMGLPAS